MGVRQNHRIAGGIECARQQPVFTLREHRTGDIFLHRDKMREHPVVVPNGGNGQVDDVARAIFAVIGGGAFKVAGFFEAAAHPVDDLRIGVWSLQALEPAAAQFFQRVARHRAKGRVGRLHQIARLGVCVGDDDGVP